MKKKIVKLLSNPMLIIFIIVIIFFMPQSIYSPGQNRDRGVVIAIGIDRQQDEFEISLLTFIPTAQQSFEQMNSVISGKGDTIAKALYQAQIAMGREIGLSHAKTTVVNQELLQEDVAQYIDYLSRVTSLTENTVFICTDTSAKEFLQASISLESTVGLQLEQIIGYNADNLYVADTSLEAFYKGYYSKHKSSLIGFLSVDKGGSNSGKDNTTGSEQAEGPTQINTSDSGANDISSSSSGSSQGQSGTQSENSSSGGSSGGQGGGSQGGGQIKNTGEAVLIKQGKFVKLLSVDELNGINLLNKESKNQIITIDNVDYKNEKLKYSYRVKNKRINVVTKFENGYPIYGCQLVLGLELVEIEGEHENLKINTEFSEITPQIREKLDENLKNEFMRALKILRDTKTDVIGISDTFYKNNRKQFNKFLKEIGGDENFLDYVTFKINFVLESD